MITCACIVNITMNRVMQIWCKASINMLCKDEGLQEGI